VLAGNFAHEKMGVRTGVPLRLPEDAAEDKGRSGAGEDVREVRVAVALLSFPLCCSLAGGLGGRGEAAGDERGGEGGRQSPSPERHMGSSGR